MKTYFNGPCTKGRMIGMGKDKNVQEKFARLRRQAEELMGVKGFALPRVEGDDPIKLIHELQAAQIELELQNEELLHSQQELSQSRISYTRLYDFAPVGYITLSLKGLILKSNLTFSGMVSMERTRLINQPLSAHILAEDQDVYYRHLRDLLDTRTGQSCDLGMKKPDGTCFDVRLTSTVCFDECGEPNHFHTIVLDVTVQKKARDGLTRAKDKLESRVRERTGKLKASNQQLKLEIAERKLQERENAKLEEQLRNAQKMEALGTLSSGIAHDFNNILTSIIAYTQLLEMREFPDDVKVSLDRILESAYQARDLVRHIMLFSRKARLVKEPVRLDRVVREVVQMMHASIPSTIRVREQIRCENCMVPADPVQIRQVLMNLCTNAVHAMHDRGGVLDITLDQVILDQDQCRSMENMTPGKYVQMIIQDTGYGIRPENISRVFDPYFTTKEPGEGTGLGLSVTLGIIKKHLGSITVTSQKGHGTRFMVLLPVR
jgi:PAS domain S-box-containing protein